MNFSKINELKPYDLNCNIFDVYSYEGLSMQELLCQFFTKINECIKTSNETIDLAEWLVNEGLKQEVALKLTNWLNDGTLENLINVTLFENLNKKIDNVNSQLEHISIVTPEMFGCVGDSITDNTQSLQNMFNSVNDNTTLILNGAYKINKQININNKRNLTICGGGTIINPDGDRGLYFYNCKNINIKDIIIDGSNLARCGVTFYDSKELNIDGIKIKNIGNNNLNISVCGLELIGNCSYSNIVNVFIDNINAQSNATGISISHYTDSNDNKVYSKYISINNCKISNIYPKADSDGIKILQNYLDSYFIIDSCTFINCSKRGIKIQGFHCKVNNCKILGVCSYAGVDFQNGKGKLSNTEISTENTYINVSLGGGDVDVNNVTIDNVGVLDNTNSGIRCTGYTSDIDKKWGDLSFRNIHMKNVKVPFRIEKIDENTFNSCNSLVFENLSIDRFNHSYMFVLNDVKINKIKLNHVSVNTQPTPFYGCVSGSNNEFNYIYVDNFNIGGIFSYNNLSEFKNASKCYINDDRVVDDYDIPYTMYNNSRKVFYWNQIPSGTSGGRIAIYKSSQVGDICVNTNPTVSNGSFTKEWVCVESASDVNIYGVWKPVNISV